MNDDIIYKIRQFVNKKDALVLKSANERPIQQHFSRWAIDEIIYELQTNYEMYPDEIIRKFISLMRLYENAAEIERKELFKTAINTAKELYSYLFE